MGGEVLAVVKPEIERKGWSTDHRSADPEKIREILGLDGDRDFKVKRLNVGSSREVKLDDINLDRVRPKNRSMMIDGNDITEFDYLDNYQFVAISTHGCFRDYIEATASYPLNYEAMLEFRHPADRLLIFP